MPWRYCFPLTMMPSDKYFSAKFYLLVLEPKSSKYLILILWLSVCTLFHFVHFNKEKYLHDGVSLTEIWQLFDAAVVNHCEWIISLESLFYHQQTNKQIEIRKHLKKQCLLRYVAILTMCQSQCVNTQSARFSIWCPFRDRIVYVS